MCNILNMIANNKSKKPVANYLAPKSLNLYFSNSLEQKLRVLNLEKISSADFYIEEVITDNRKLFVLKCNYELWDTKESNTVDLASFINKNEAEQALKDTRISLNKPSKILYESLAVTLISLIIANLALNFCITMKDEQIINNIKKEEIAQIKKNIDNANAINIPNLPKLNGSDPISSLINMQITPEQMNEIKRKTEIESNVKLIENMEKMRKLTEEVSNANTNSEAPYPLDKPEIEKPRNGPPNPADSLLNKLK